MRKKVLLVDDSATVLLMEKMILSKGPYDIITASNGEEAILKAHREQPDVILLDVVMPKLDGLAACAAIHAHEETSHIPIVMVTTRSEVDNVEKAFKNGCVDYVTKPINGLELLTKLQSILSLKVSA